jgi:ketosteroid isomerase-like protein
MTVEEDVLAVGEAWDAALVANDAAAFTEFVTDDWVYIDSKGATTKAALVGWIRTGRLAHHTMRTVGEPRVAIHGDTAIVTARKASSGTWDGVAYTADEWITAVFVREGERWLCALSQKSPVET